MPGATGERESEWRLSGNKKMESKYFELFIRNCFFGFAFILIFQAVSSSRSFLIHYFVIYWFPSIWTSNLCLISRPNFIMFGLSIEVFPKNFIRAFLLSTFIDYHMSFHGLLFIPMTYYELLFIPHDILRASIHPNDILMILWPSVY